MKTGCLLLTHAGNRIAGGRHYCPGSNHLIRKTGLVFMLSVTMLCFLVSCRKDAYKINVSAVDVDLKLLRLEKDLFGPDPGEVSGNTGELIEKYRDFLQMFSLVINAGNIHDSSFAGILNTFCTDKLNNEVYDSVLKYYPDIESLEQELEDAFRHYLWYFPGKKVPSVFTCISGFNSSLIISDTIIGIGLDRYLGGECIYYRHLGIYSYMAKRMNSYNIVPDCIYGWALTEWDYDSTGYKGDNLLNRMIHEGKLRYFGKCMMPGTNDTLLLGFSRGQMEFCRDNERQMWQYLVSNNLLFSSDQLVIRKLLGEAPFTGYFTSESPGRACAWIGFRIVESYMMREKGRRLGDLMDNTNVQGILEGAKYDP
jgi:hypothetical protein